MEVCKDDRKPKTPHEICKKIVSGSLEECLGTYKITYTTRKDIDDQGKSVFICKSDIYTVLNDNGSNKRREIRIENTQHITEKVEYYEDGKRRCSIIKRSIIDEPNYRLTTLEKAIYIIFNENGKIQAKVILSSKEELDSACFYDITVEKRFA